MTKKVERSALNIKIVKSIKDRLDELSKNLGVSQTQIVELALSEYFANHDAELDEAKVVVDSSDTTTSTINAKTNSNEELEQLKQQLKDQQNQINRLEENKVEQQQLDERLAMATEPIWESLDDDGKDERNTLKTNDAKEETTDKSGESLSYDELAKMYGISRNSLENWQKGKTNPRANKKQIWEEIKNNWKLGDDGRWHIK